ncbi:hypothetical protein T265_05882 [Opisthorchis viverrini]|uniref:Uncharacterized protein n=1 Tax=Opisthorchis viverrini TaxID=6198 RepID=A0A074ZU99_OPIVI|nr:hypothetical protein T265_05882 [Opisthorchis viverrini]KER26975.1 hypothetical protein T265_05882 [Opisthorchis viverrini]
MSLQKGEKVIEERQRSGNYASNTWKAFSESARLVGPVKPKQAILLHQYRIKNPAPHENGAQETEEQKSGKNKTILKIQRWGI